MLDSETKRRIDSARDILVGKVPDPKSQVEQITIALIYKFMDDMDAEAEELGGKRKFFTGEFARYGWAKLMSPGIGGHELIGLYGEGIAKMLENPGIPPLFRDIFKNAYLPYRDPETLKSFLKIINEFSYDHSEDLGDAFEYLLSVLGSQGDAGQFRTPRHIIDFIVDIIEPKKDEVILDPACGTAGFLISAYKYILRTNKDAKSANTLTPDEKGKLAQHFKGYDISPDMVRLSLTNLYLHGFSEPHVYEYDTLTSEERWNEFADVILANPPFMSPKGGIKPHKRFSIQAKRSEVLFVDYIAEHLKPNGRAGIIVPEGIIFQSQTAYKDLRKMLVENSLVAVISLPAGVFNPYSGVKTSILILDKSLAKQSNTIAFFKIENDGFSLGAQRRANAGGQLSQVKLELSQYLQALRSQQPTINLQPELGLIIPREKVAANVDYCLRGERYREGVANNYSFPLISLGEADLFHVESGGTPKSGVEEYWNGGIPWATLVDLPPTEFITQITSTKRTISEQGLRESSAKMIPANSVIVSTRATIGRIAINRVPIATNQGFKNVVILDLARAIPEYIALALTRLVPTMKAWATGGTFAEISKSKFCELKIPLPPLEIQKEIVAEIEGYQKVIDGARTVVDNYRPHIPINPDWPTRELGSLAENLDSRRIPITKGVRKEGPYPYYGASGIVDYVADYIFDDNILLISEDGANLLARSTPIAFSVSGKCWVNNHAHVLKFEHRCTQKFVEIYLNSIFIDKYITGSAQPKLNQQALNNITIPIPNDIASQHAITTEIEAEQVLVTANQELITRFEKKIQAALARVWGEDNDKKTAKFIADSDNKKNECEQSK